MEGMTRKALATAVLAGGLLAVPLVPAAAQQTGFGFCVAPALPRCIGDEATYRGAGPRDACEDDIQMYEGLLVRYRECLLQAMQRTLTQGNKAIARFRCRTRQALCSGDPARN
jgi:hypothetical protein